MVGKKKILLLVLSLVFALAIPVSLSAHGRSMVMPWQGKDKHSVSVSFRANATIIDVSYRDNATFITQIDSLFDVLNNDPRMEIVSVEIGGTASPEGTASRNKKLSHTRMMVLDAYLRESLELPDSIVKYNDQYITWQHLTQLVDSDPNPIAHKERVLEILQKENLVGIDRNGDPQDGRINAIYYIDNGATWQLLQERYFPEMRNAWVTIVTTNRDEAVAPIPAAEPQSTTTPVGTTTLVAVTQNVQPSEPAPVKEQVVKPQPAKMVPLTQRYSAELEKEGTLPLMNIKTNSLEVLALIANLGFEVRLSPRFSFDVIGSYSPFDSIFNSERKIRVLAAQPEVRFWWGEALYQGHFIGVHVPVAGFNVQVNDKYRWQDPNHALWGVGVSYGYAMPLGKSKHWGVEFTIGVGYMDVTYDVYEGVFNGKYIRTETKNYFGLTRLGIDFTYRFNKSKNKNK